MDKRLEKDLTRSLRRRITDVVAAGLKARSPRCALCYTIGSNALGLVTIHWTCLNHDAAWAEEVHLGTEWNEGDPRPTLGSPCPPYRIVDGKAHQARAEEEAEASQLILANVLAEPGSKEE